MPARIPLVISQPAMKHAAADDCVENAVAAAMLVAGVDANLIGDIESIAVGSTDHLCLQGLTRDIVLCAFLSAERAQQALNRLSIAGRWVDFAADAAALRTSQSPAIAERRIFFYPLTPGQSVNDLLDRCQQLVAAQKQPLVHIQLGSLRQAPALDAVTPATAASKVRISRPAPPAAIPEAASPEVMLPKMMNQPQSAAQAAQPLRSVPEEEDDLTRPQWDAIDRLVDDLDALDL
jgi:hypothetical protein